MLVSNLNFKERWYFFTRRLQLFNFFLFAHHPLCKNYYQEVIFFKGLAFCRGCTEVYITTITTVIITLLVDPFKSLSLVDIFFIIVMITLPTWLAIIYPFKRRLIKDIVRITLGIGFGIAITELIVSSSWVEKGIIIILIMIFYYIFKIARRYSQKKIFYNLCDECSKFTADMCPLYQKQFEVERQYSRELSDLLQKKLSWETIQGQVLKNRILEQK